MRWAADARHAKYVRLSMEALTSSQRIIADIPRPCRQRTELNFKITYNSRYVEESRVTTLSCLTCSLEEVRDLNLFVVSQPNRSSDALTETAITMGKCPPLAANDHLFIDIVADDNTFTANYEVQSGIEKTPLVVVRPQAASVSDLLQALAHLETTSTQFRKGVFGSHTVPRPSPQEQAAITQQLIQTKAAIDAALLALSTI